MSTLILFLVSFLTMGVVAQNTTCDLNRWGPPDCWNVCGECFVSTEGDRICDVNTGDCKQGCVGDYTGPKCVEAVCKNGCSGGVCIAPGICANCPDINKVAPNCEDIRLRGLLGSAIAFAVIITSITLCGLGSNIYKRRARRHDSV